ncbi:MAG: hypothetical protein NVSMB27_47370 [Ktedonobacteraceae bacterium]
MTELAAALVHAQRDFSPFEGMSNEEVSTYISPIRGVGRWTADEGLRGCTRRPEEPVGEDEAAWRNVV